MPKLVEKISLVEAVSIARHLEKSLEERDEIVCATVAGSIRRQCEFIGDIDIVAVNKELKDGEGKIEKFVYFSQQYPVQVYHCSYDDYEATLLFLTGSYEFNMATRVAAKKLGWSLSQYGLKMSFRVVRCELEILKFLGFECCLDPRNRSKGCF